MEVSRQVRPKARAHRGIWIRGEKIENVTLTCFDDLMLDAVTIPIGERDWRVECVRDQGRVLAYAESHDQAPYGLLLWESAVALCDHCIAGPRSLQTSKFWNWVRASGSLGLWPAAWVLRSG